MFLYYIVKTLVIIKRYTLAVENKSGRSISSLGGISIVPYKIQTMLIKC